MEEMIDEIEQKKNVEYRKQFVTLGAGQDVESGGSVTLTLCNFHILMALCMDTGNFAGFTPHAEPSPC